MIAGLTLALVIAGRRKLAVAQKPQKADLGDGKTRDVRDGDVVPRKVIGVKTRPARTT